jgi:hypothetical protein
MPLPQEPHGAENPDDIQIQKSNLRLTGWLVIVGGIQAVILFFTIRAINQQTDANRNIERAWVMAELRCSPVALLAHGDGPEGPTVGVMSVELHCTNDGNSPAWITERSARVIIAGEGELPPIPQLMEEDILTEIPEPMGPGRESTFRGARWGREGIRLLRKPHSSTGSLDIGTYSTRAGRLGFAINCSDIGTIDP